jgi:hypothetical protein
MLVERYEQFGDPLYFSQSLRLFTGEYASILGANLLGFEYSAFDYIDDHGFGKFVENFVLMGIYNMFLVLFKMSFPYLIVFLPFGIIFSLRAFDQEKKYIQSNWILILITLVPFILYFAILPEKRFIYHVYPFLIILAIIPLQRLIEYGLSTFSYDDRQKKIILTGIMGAVLLSSCFYTLRYDLPDPVLNDEKILFADILSKQFEGKILDAGNTLQGLGYVNITNPPGIFKNYEQTEDYVIQYTMGFNKKNINLMPTTLYAKSLEDFIKVSYEYELKYISINKNGVEDVFYPYLDEIYENEKDFPYLTKVFDTESEGFEKLKAKVFEIDYKKFYQLGN